MKNRQKLFKNFGKNIKTFNKIKNKIFKQKIKLIIVETKIKNLNYHKKIFKLKYNLYILIISMILMKISHY